MNPEQKLEGGVRVPWSYSAHQTVPHLQRSSFQPHPNSCIPSGDLCVCCSREWALTTQARICRAPPTCPGSHPNSPLQPPAQTTESGVAGEQRDNPSPPCVSDLQAQHPAPLPSAGLLPRAWPGWVQGPCGIRRCGSLGCQLQNRETTPPTPPGLLFLAPRSSRKLRGPGPLKPTTLPGSVSTCTRVCTRISGESAKRHFGRT